MRGRGFTLIELMVALAIAGLLLVLAAPLYSRWIADAQVQNGAESIASGLRLAMAEAIKQNTTVEFVLDAAPGGGWVVQVPGVPPPIQAGTFVEGADRAAFAVSPAANTTVTFTPLGQIAAANADASAPFEMVDVTSAVADTRQLRVLVGAGRTGIKICDRGWPATDPKGCPNAIP